MNTYVKLNGLIYGTSRVVFLKLQLFPFPYLILDTHTLCPKILYKTLCPELDDNSTVWWPGLVSAGGQSEISSHYSLILFFRPLREVCFLNDSSALDLARSWLV